MNHRQIEAFRAIMLTGTTARAAQYMHTSQPAVSRLLAQLEASLQMRLFERERSRLRAMPAWIICSSTRLNCALDQAEALPWLVCLLSAWV